MDRHRWMDIQTDTDGYTDRQQSDFINLLFFQNKETTNEKVIALP
jgi:hypothetical protein